MILGAACSRPPRDPLVFSKPDDKKPVDSVHTGAGSAIRMSSLKEGRKKLWSVEYRWATIEYEGEEKFGGRMQDVKGVFYNQESGEPASTFEAKYAVADKTSSTLRVHGEVTVTYIKEKATLTCKSVTYLAEKAIVEAEGNVSVDSPTYVMSGLPKVMTDEDFTIVATPEYFENPNVEKTKK